MLLSRIRQSLLPSEEGVRTYHGTSSFIYQTSARKKCGHEACNQKASYRGFKWSKAYSWLSRKLVVTWFCYEHAQCIMCGIHTRKRQEWGDNNYIVICGGCLPPMCTIDGCGRDAFTFTGVVSVCRNHMKCMFPKSDGSACDKRAGVDITINNEVFAVCKNHLHHGVPLDPRCIAVADNKRCIKTYITCYSTTLQHEFKLCSKHYKKRYDWSLLTVDPCIEKQIIEICRLTSQSNKQTDQLTFLPQEIFNNIAIWLDDRDLKRLRVINKRLSRLVVTYSISMLSATMTRFIMDSRKILLPNHYYDMLVRMKVIKSGGLSRITF